MRLIDADAYAFPGDLINEPTIDAKLVRHGHWEEDDTCSCCHSEMLLWVGYMGNVRVCKSNYCPNCGAKMDLEVSQ